MMAKATTIPIDPEVRDRLRSFGHAGMTYSDIVTSVLDKLDREAFVRELRRRAADPKVVWVPAEDIEWD
jgi:hypothetical protein